MAFSTPLLKIFKVGTSNKTTGKDDVLKRFDYDIVAEIENNIIKEAVS